MLWADWTAVVSSSFRDSVMSRRSCRREVTAMISSATSAVPIMSMIFILKLSLLMGVSWGASVVCSCCIFSRPAGPKLCGEPGQGDCLSAGGSATACGHPDPRRGRDGHPAGIHHRGRQCQGAHGGTPDVDVHKPNAALTGQIVAKAREKGLILLSCGTYGNVLRVLVPLTAEDALLDRGLAIIAECFDELA